MSPNPHYDYNGDSVAMPARIHRQGFWPAFDLPSGAGRFARELCALQEWVAEESKLRSRRPVDLSYIPLPFEQTCGAHGGRTNQGRPCRLPCGGGWELLTKEVTWDLFRTSGVARVEVSAFRLTGGGVKTQIDARLYGPGLPEVVGGDTLVMCHPLPGFSAKIGRLAVPDEKVSEIEAARLLLVRRLTVDTDLRCDLHRRTA